MTILVTPPATPTAADIIGDLPDSICRKKNPHLNSNRTGIMNLLKDKKIAQPKEGSKAAQVRALREANAERNEAAAKVPMAKRPPAPIKLTWKDGRATSRWAHFLITEADPENGKRTLMVITADANAPHAMHESLSALADAATIHVNKLRDSGAPEYKAPAPVKQEKTTMKSKSKAQKGKAAHAAKKAAKAATTRRKPAKAASGPRTAKAARAVTVPAKPKGETKGAQAIAMLQKSWTAMPDLLKAMGWLPHTTRAFLSGLKKKGLTVEHKRDDGVAFYRITK